MVGGILLVFGVSAGCGSSGSGSSDTISPAPSDDAPTISLSAPLYRSVEELKTASDAVVLGARGIDVDAYVSSDPDMEPEDQDGRFIGRPYVLTSFDVVDSAKGGEEGEKILVLIDDLSRISIEGLSEIPQGERVLLFLNRLPGGAYPGVDLPNEPVYILTTPSDNAVFDVEDGLITARSDDVWALTQAAATPPEVGADGMRRLSFQWESLAAGTP